MMSVIHPTISPITGWSEISPSGGLADSLNPSSRTPAIASFNGKIYVAWAGETGSFTTYFLYCASYDPSTGVWTRVDPGSSIGLNISSSQDALTPNLCVFNNKLYIIWQEGTNSTFIRVKVYNGNDAAPSWALVDGGSASGLNRSSARVATSGRLTILNNKLYATWIEQAQSGGNRNHQVRCRVYNGNDSSPSWTFVDGNTGTGLNKSVTYPASQPFPGIFNGKLYLGWFEEASSGRQLRCRVYNGNDSSPSWTFVDGNGSLGLNYDTSAFAGTSGSTERHGTLFSHNSKLYVLWQESGKARMKVYNGNDAAPSWALVDGGGSNGLCFEGSASLNSVAAIVPDTWGPYMFWSESTVRASIYNAQDASPKAINVDTKAEFTARGTFMNVAFLDSIYLASIISAKVFVWKTRV